MHKILDCFKCNKPPRFMPFRNWREPHNIIDWVFCGNCFNVKQAASIAEWNNYIKIELDKRKNNVL